MSLGLTYPPGRPFGVLGSHQAGLMPESPAALQKAYEKVLSLP